MFVIWQLVDFDIDKRCLSWQNKINLPCDIDKPNEGEYDEGGDEVVGLVVEQVVHNTVPPLVRLADVRNLEPAQLSDHY